MPKVDGNIRLRREKHKGRIKNTEAYLSHVEAIRTYFEEREEEDQDKEFISYIKDDLMEFFDISEEEADKMISKSVFMELLKDDPDYVYHYEAEYWAHYIFQTQMIRTV
ncbi:hypothetical protein P4572_19150 [Priestia megaterium]|uniref:hypothetical protein n=1 Tax=Priestia megaterium TaxID=1404 RepID=UPI002E24ED0F|nr:hypothetical protein [Priestia megaterium]MED4219175.1 hypothetical protein [Priestia megaterium]